MLYTRKGDTGTSGLYGTKERLPKDSPVYEALGTLDELNSWLGYCRAHTLARDQTEGTVECVLFTIQECLFIVQAEVAGAAKRISQAHVDDLERITAVLEMRIENPHAFVVPGSTELSGMLDYARSVSRRAERTVVALASERAISHTTKAYLNRLSSLLYATARYVATRAEIQEVAPTYTGAVYK